MLISNTHDDEFVIYDEYDFSSGIRGRFYHTYNTTTTMEGVIHLRGDMGRWA